MPKINSNAKLKALSVRIGAKIRQLREERGMSQSQLADQIDVTYQQVFKYETGVNRISAPRLKWVADALKVEMSAFFEEDEPNLITILAAE